VVEGLTFFTGPIVSNPRSKELNWGSSFTPWPMITGKGTSFFSVHLVSSLPKKVISGAPERLRCWPSPLRRGKEKVIEIKRKKLKIFINLCNISNVLKYQIY
jgi:hypothetical protein